MQVRADRIKIKIKVMMKGTEPRSWYGGFGAE